MKKSLKVIIITAIILTIALIVVLLYTNFFRPSTPVYKIPSQPNTEKKINLNQDDCARAGCSGELCLPAAEAEDVFTTCIYKPEYDCYQKAICKRLETGECGFVEDETLINCLKQAGTISL